VPENPVRWVWFAAVRGIESSHWITPGDASELIGVPPTTLRRWTREGVVSYMQWEEGKRRWYSWEELQELLTVLGNAPTLWMIRGYIAAQLATE
jgi:hypothetical protein